MMNFIRQVKTVLWAFLGIRSNSGREEDAKEISNPFIFLGIALGLFVIFVISLIVIVNLVV